MALSIGGASGRSEAVHAVSVVKAQQLGFAQPRKLLPQPRDSLIPIAPPTVRLSLLAKLNGFAVVPKLFLDYGQLLKSVVSGDITIPFKRSGSFPRYGYLLAAPFYSFAQGEII